MDDKLKKKNENERNKKSYYVIDFASLNFRGAFDLFL